VSLPELELDTLTWDDLVDLARRAIPAASEGQWTLHAPVDPGFTLLELFAAELEQKLFTLDQVPDTLVRAVMRLLLGPAGGPRPAVAATAVLALDTDTGPGVLPAGAELGQAGDGPPLLLTTEHAVLVVPEARISGLLVGETDAWPRLEAGEPVALFGPDGRSAAEIRVAAGSPADEHRLYLALEQPAGGLGWVDDDARKVFLDTDGQPLAQGRLGALAAPAERTLAWTAVVGNQRWPLRVEDGTAGLRTSGVVRLRPPANRSFPASFGIGVSGPGSGAPVHRLVSAVTVNAVVARHRRRIERPLVVDAAVPVPRRELELVAADAGGELPADRVMDGRGLVRLAVRRPDGTKERWTAVDDLAFSGPGQRHLQIDRERGVLRFGDGTAGRIPRWPPGTTVSASYWLGGGVPPEVGPGVRFDSPAGGPVSGVTVTRLRWGQEPESMEAARARAAQELSRGARGVTADDLEAVVRGVPGVRLARVHVQPGLDLGHPGVPVPDAVTLFCLPAVRRLRPEDQRAVPAPDLDDWSLAALACALERTRLVGSQLAVRGPAYRRLDLEAELEVRAADRAAVRRRAERELRRYLDPLAGGPGGDGWDFGASVRPADLSATLQRALGRQAEVTAVRVTEAGTDGWDDCQPLALRAYELPLLERVTLRSAPAGR
jgi:predicted phage baseplate assembly protein